MGSYPTAVTETAAYQRLGLTGKWTIRRDRRRSSERFNSDTVGDRTADPTTGAAVRAQPASSLPTTSHSLGMFSSVKIDSAIVSFAVPSSFCWRSSEPHCL